MNSPLSIHFSAKLSAQISAALVLTTFLSSSLAAQQPVALVNSEKQETAEAKAEVSEVDLGGQWSGSWVSCKNGHNGKLKATFCRLNDSQVQAVFVGSFAKILPFRYRAVLDIVHEEPGMIQLRGSQKLGPIMGTFCYEATISGDQFQATYRSRRDCGKWSMKKVPCCCE